MRQLHVVDGDDLSDESLLEDLMLCSIAISESRNSAVLIGAGVSTNAGIPDFRSSSKGIYSNTSPNSSTRTGGPGAYSAKNLFSYSSLLDQETRSAHVRFMANLHHQCSNFNPTSRGSPTVFHDLLKRVDNMERLLRVYSQNVDGFEEDAGLNFVNLELDGDKMGPRGSRRSQDREGDSSGSEYGDGGHNDSSRKRRKRSHSSSSSVEAERWYQLPRSQKVVAMHGSLRSVICSACGWKGNWDERISRKFEKGKRVDCPRCEQRSNLRLSASKRPLPTSALSFLRPNLLLYDDPSSTHSAHLSSLTSLSAFDLSSRPDFLLVAGTSLQIPGFKQLVKEFAKEVKLNGGICVLVNREAVASSWNSVFDIEFRMDADAFASSIISNLDALSPSTAMAKLRSTDSPSASISGPQPLASHGTPSPKSLTKITKLSNVSHLPTPSPTPPLPRRSSLGASDSFFAPQTASLPFEVLTHLVINDQQVSKTGSIEHLPSPSPTSSPTRSRSTSRSQSRSAELYSPVADLIDGASIDGPLSVRAAEVEQGYEVAAEAERVYTVEESRSLVDDLLRQAQTIVEEGSLFRGK
ncbi:hypothetical protein JCM3765_000514 [Sporobolomyces pararoseus]